MKPALVGAELAHIALEVIESKGRLKELRL